MKRPGHAIGSVPVKLTGGPFDGQVLRVEELMPEIRLPIPTEMVMDFSAIQAIDKTPKALDIRVAVYHRTGEETTLQLPFPAPPDAKRIGYEYGFVRETTS